MSRSNRYKIQRTNIVGSAIKRVVVVETIVTKVSSGVVDYYSMGSV